jgi:holliday junction DNA helicase RuvA
MISFLEGVIAEKLGDRVLLAVNGIGYELWVPAQTLGRLPPAGRKVKVFTRLQVREEALVLYGFSSVDERGLFDHLVTVSGVGPKMALAILSVLSPDALRRAISSGDADAISLAPGVGKKLANRIIVDLKDRVGAGGDAPVSGPMAEVREALVALGLSGQEAREAIASIPPDGDRPVEELLRLALQGAGRA